MRLPLNEWLCSLSSSQYVWDEAYLCLHICLHSVCPTWCVVVFPHAITVCVQLALWSYLPLILRTQNHAGIYPCLHNMHTSWSRVVFTNCLHSVYNLFCGSIYPHLTSTLKHCGISSQHTYKWSTVALTPIFTVCVQLVLWSYLPSAETLWYCFATYIQVEVR